MPRLLVIEFNTFLRMGSDASSSTDGTRRGEADACRTLQIV